MSPSRLRGELDVSNCDDRFTDLVENGEADAAAVIEIDCSELEFIDSSGLNMLLRLRRESGKDIVLYGVPSACRRVFEVTRLDEVFELRDS
jgi:anti-anti-sigma factor